MATAYRLLWAMFLLAFVLNAAKPPTCILILGDSLTEGYGVETEQAFPAILQTQLRALQPQIKVVNGGSSGSTSAGAVRRLKWYARVKPDWVILTLGSNDGLRGVKISETRKNIEAAILYCEAQHWPVLLTGLKVPPNYGEEYAKAFTTTFKDLAAIHHLPYFPFLLEGVAGEPGMNQADGIHPNAKGHEKIAHNLFEFLKNLKPLGL